jgi:hypothetical protein
VSRRPTTAGEEEEAERRGRLGVDLPPAGDLDRRRSGSHDVEHGARDGQRVLEKLIVHRSGPQVAELAIGRHDRT